MSATQNITLKLPIGFDIPVEYVDTTPEENAAILLLGRTILGQLRRESYTEQVQSLEKQLVDERSHTDRFRVALESLAQALDQSVEQAVSKSFESMTYEVAALTREELNRDKSERSAVMTTVRRERDAIDRRVESVSALLDRVHELATKEHSRVGPMTQSTYSTSASRGHENEMASERMIVDAFGSAGASFEIHDKRNFAGDHVFDWNGLRIMWEDKCYTNTVPRAEVDKGWRDLVGNPDCHVLLFVSARSGIAGRDSSSGLVSEVRNGQLALFLSNFKSNPDPVGYLRLVIQTVLLAIKPLLLLCRENGNEAVDERIRFATTILTELSEAMAVQQRECESMASDFRARLGAMQNSLERTRTGINLLSQKLVPTVSSKPESQRSERKCRRCQQTGHDARTCSA